MLPLSFEKLDRLAERAMELCGVSDPPPALEAVKDGVELRARAYLDARDRLRFSKD